MPKQIKKEQIKKSELYTENGLLQGLRTAAVFMGCMAGLNEHDSENPGGKSANDSAFLAAFII